MVDCVMVDCVMVGSDMLIGCALDFGGGGPSPPGHAGVIAASICTDSCYGASCCSTGPYHQNRFRVCGEEMQYW